jgi:hypothetical protein
VVVAMRQQHAGDLMSGIYGACEVWVLIR